MPLKRWCFVGAFVLTTIGILSFVLVLGHKLPIRKITLDSRTHFGLVSDLAPDWVTPSSLSVGLDLDSYLSRHSISYSHTYFSGLFNSKAYLAILYRSFAISESASMLVVYERDAALTTIMNRKSSHFIHSETIEISVYYDGSYSLKALSEE